MAPTPARCRHPHRARRHTRRVSFLPAGEPCRRHLQDPTPMCCRWQAGHRRNLRTPVTVAIAEDRVLPNWATLFTLPLPHPGARQPICRHRRAPGAPVAQGLPERWPPTLSLGVPASQALDSPNHPYHRKRSVGTCVTTADHSHTPPDPVSTTPRSGVEAPWAPRYPGTPGAPVPPDVSEQPPDLSLEDPGHRRPRRPGARAPAATTPDPTTRRPTPSPPPLNTLNRTAFPSHRCEGSVRGIPHRSLNR